MVDIHFDLELFSDVLRSECDYDYKRWELRQSSRTDPVLWSESHKLTERQALLIPSVQYAPQV